MTGRESCVPRRAPITRAAHFGGRPGLFRTRRPRAEEPDVAVRRAAGAGGERFVEKQIRGDHPLDAADSDL